MPFDTGQLRRPKLRQPTVTILPPTPPERGGPRRITINIEIGRFTNVSKPAPGHRLGAFICWLILLLLFASLAHAQQHYEHWSDTNGWHGQTRSEGRTTDWDAYGPHGQQRHCHRYFVGDQPYTNCTGNP
jgi:hypothetical protein